MTIDFTLDFNWKRQTENELRSEIYISGEEPGLSLCLSNAMMITEIHSITTNKCLLTELYIINQYLEGVYIQT
jgi:hypothetical protein